MLTQLPGVGPFTALVILAEVGDVSRFGSARKLASWAGPTTDRPRQRPRRPLRAHLERKARWLRWVLCEAAQTAKRSPQFAAGYQAIATRRGKKIATTAAARKLATRAWHLLTDSQRPQPPQLASAPAAQTGTR